MEEFFGSEEALRCFEKSEAIDEKIRQMWTLPNVQVKAFTCCAWSACGEKIYFYFLLSQIYCLKLYKGAGTFHLASQSKEGYQPLSFAQELLKATVTEDGGGKSEAESRRWNVAGNFIYYPASSLSLSLFLSLYFSS